MQIDQVGQHLFFWYTGLLVLFGCISFGAWRVVLLLVVSVGAVRGLLFLFWAIKILQISINVC